MLSEPKKWRRVFFFLLFVLIGLLARATMVESLPGLFFSFRRFAALVIAVRLGPFPGLAAMAIIMSDLGDTVGNYYSLFVFCGEAFFLGWMRRRHPDRALVVADGIFWPLVGLPALGLAYYFARIASVEIVVLILLKVWLNGICDAYLAGLVADSRLADRLLGTPDNRPRSLHQYVKNRFGILALPILLMVVFAVIGVLRTQAYASLEDRVASGLAIARAYLDDASADAEAVRALDGLVLDGESSFELSPDTAEESWAAPERLRPGVFLRRPADQRHPLERWRRTELYGELETGGTRLRYTVPFESTFKYLYRIFAAALGFAMAFMYGIYSNLFLVVKSLDRRLEEVAAEAGRLPDRIADGEAAFRKNSDITEINILIAEFRVVSRSLQWLFDVLHRTNDRLESQVAEGTKELRHLAEELRLLLCRNEREGERERIRIARELHDEFGQYLTALSMGLYLLERKLAAVDEPTAEKISEMKMLLTRLSEEMRRIIADLRPGVLDRIGLGEALNALAAERGKQAGIEIACESIPSAELKLGEDERTTIYRIAQEALTNSIKHSGSERIIIRLRADDKTLILEVQDWGRGFDVMVPGAEGRISYGLVGMRERCRSLGGSLDVISSPDSGTCVQARIPMGVKE